MKFAVLALLGLVAVQAIQMQEPVYDEALLAEGMRTYLLKRTMNFWKEVLLQSKVKLITLTKTTLCMVKQFKRKFITFRSL